MPRILIVCEYATLNGGEHSLLAVLPQLSELGCELHVAAPPDGGLAQELVARRIPVYPFSVRSPGGKRRAVAELHDLLQRIVADCRPDLLHANSLSMSRLTGPLVRHLKLPSVAHLRDIIKLSPAAYANINLHRRIIAVSEATRQWHLHLGLAEEKTVVVYNGVDLERFQPRDATGYLHRELGLSPQTVLLGAIGQLGLRKGLDITLAAVRRLVDLGRDLHLLIIGRRLSQKAEALAYEAALHSSASRAALRGRVHFLGVRDDVPRVLNELTLLVHLARQEPLGRVLLEAAAAGTPVVASNAGGTREVFPDDRTGRVVAVDNELQAATAISELICAPELRRQLSRAARERIEQQFDARQSATALFEQYVACLR